MKRSIDTKITELLRCPCCFGGLHMSEEKGSLLCDGAKAHCFDISSSGHVNFAMRHGAAGDSKEAVRSRRDFLDTGAYAPVADAVAETLCELLPSGAAVIDAGSGEG